jgi:hypothetical protein
VCSDANLRDDHSSNHREGRILQTTRGRGTDTFVNPTQSDPSHTLWIISRISSWVFAYI